jgi:hypothetical protein
MIHQTEPTTSDRRLSGGRDRESLVHQFTRQLLLHRLKGRRLRLKWRVLGNSTANPKEMH